MDQSVVFLQFWDYTVCRFDDWALFLCHISQISWASGRYLPIFSFFFFGLRFYSRVQNLNLIGVPCFSALPDNVWLIVTNQSRFIIDILVLSQGGSFIWSPWAWCEYSNDWILSCPYAFFLTEHHAMKAYWTSGGMAPLILCPRH